MTNSERALQQFLSETTRQICIASVVLCWCAPSSSWVVVLGCTLVLSGVCCAEEHPSSVVCWEHLIYICWSVLGARSPICVVLGLCWGCVGSTSSISCSSCSRDDVAIPCHLSTELFKCHSPNARLQHTAASARHTTRFESQLPLHNLTDTRNASKRLSLLPLQSISLLELELCLHLFDCRRLLAVIEALTTRRIKTAHIGIV